MTLHAAILPSFYDNSFLVGVAATNGCGSSSAEVSPITQSSPPVADMVDMDSIYCIEEPVTFTDSSTGGKYMGLILEQASVMNVILLMLLLGFLSQTLDLPYYLVLWEHHHWITLILLLMELQSLW